MYFLKPEYHTPISTYVYGPKSFQVAFQGMQIRAWEIHIVDAFRKLQSEQNRLQTFCMGSLDTLSAPGRKEQPKPFMPDVLNHAWQL